MTSVANPYLRLRSIYALLLLVASCALPARSGAEERFHFEGPYLTQPGRILKDHALARVGDTWHCFYIQGEIGASQSSEDSLGHATSKDLRLSLIHI